MTPEQASRKHIDHQLDQAGWIVQNDRQLNISAGLGTAVWEFPLTTGAADYLLYVDGKVIGVVEAKPNRRGAKPPQKAAGVRSITTN